MSKVKVGPDNVGRLLFAAARKSKSVALGLAGLLVSPRGFFPPVPQLGLRELLTAIRVADLVPTQLWSDQTKPLREDFETLSGRWRDARIRLFTELRGHLRNCRPPLETEDIQEAIHVFEQLPIHLDLVMSDLKQLYELLDVRGKQYERLGLTRSPWKMEKKSPQRGNRFSEHHQRIVAALELLKSTHFQKEQNALQVVSKLHSQYGLKQTPESLRKLLDRYEVAYSRNRPGCLVMRRNLPAFWLDGQIVNSLGSYLLWYCHVERVTFRDCLEKIGSQ